MRVQATVKGLLGGLILLASLSAHAGSKRVLAYFQSVAQDERGEYSELVVNPHSSGAVTIRVRKGGLKKEFLHTVLDVELKTQSPCILLCEAELVRVLDIIAPHDLPEAFSEHQ